MSWKERSRMDERVLLVGEYLKGEVAMSLLAREFGISRKTAYKWVARYREAGPGGLADRSRAPLMHPRRVDPTAVEAVLMARRSHPHWGPRKILAWLAVKHPQLAVPVPSTVSAIFAKYGLSWARQGAATHAAVHGSVRRGGRGQSRVVHRLQGGLQDGRRTAVLSAHADRRLQSRPASMHGATLAEDGARTTGVRGGVS